MASSWEFAQVAKQHVPETWRVASTERALFDKACDLFEARLLRAIPPLVKDGFLFQATMLTAIAIDVLADTMVIDPPANGDHYVSAIEDHLPSYAPYASRFYASVRCGLVHRVQLKALPWTDSKGHIHEPEGPAALSDGVAPPRLSDDKLIIDVKHLVDEFFRAYDAFKSGPIGNRQRNLSERMVQTVYNETSRGLVEVGQTRTVRELFEDEQNALLQAFESNNRTYGSS